MNIYPYVYRIDHPSGEFYIGYRCANKVPAELDLGYKYKTSSKYLSYPFEEYHITILAEFFTDTAKTDAYDFEQLTIFENWSDPNIANKSCHYGRTRWSMAGMPHSEESKKKISMNHIGMQGRKQSSETKKKIADLSKGRKHTEETKRKIAINHTGVPKGPFTDETKSRMAIAQRARRNREKLVG